MIVGHGVDIVQVSRIAKAHGLVHRICSEEEKTDDPCRLAGIWACKEAALKAFGTGIGSLSFLDFRIAHEKTGQPFLVLSERANKRLKALGGKQVLVSISHEREYAIASVILDG